MIKIICIYNVHESQKIDKVQQNLVDFTYYRLTIHYYLKNAVDDFWKVICNREWGTSVVQKKKCYPHIICGWIFILYSLFNYGGKIFNEY